MESAFARFLQNTPSASDPSALIQGRGTGQQLGLLIGEQLATDLTNVPSLRNALNAANDPRAGGATETPQVHGAGAMANLDQMVGKQLKDLLKPDDHKH